MNATSHDCDDAGRVAGPTLCVNPFDERVLQGDKVDMIAGMLRHSMFGADATSVHNELSTPVDLLLHAHAIGPLRIGDGRLQRA